MFKVFLRLFFAALLLWAPTSSAEEGVNIFKEPRKVPMRQIKHQSGQNLKLSDFKGNFTLALFWSRNCGPCVKELRSLNTFYKETLGNGISLVMISPAEEWNSMNEQKRFLKKYGAPDVPFYVDEGGQLAADFGIFSKPHTILINAEGFEIGRIRGGAQWDDPRVIQYIYKLKAKTSDL